MTARVAITTAADAAPRVASLVTAAGLIPVVLPCVAITTDLDGVARARSVAADWLVVTSARAVTAVWPSGEMPDYAVAAVGEATAETVERAGGRVALIGRTGAAELIDRLAAHAAGSSILFPHGHLTDDLHLARLRRIGTVTAIPVYDTQSTAPESDPADAVLFGSPSAVAGWCGARGLDDLAVGAIGTTTGQALLDVGRSADFVAERPTFAALVEAAADHLFERSPS